MKILRNDIAVLEHDTHISRWVEQSGRLDHDQNMLPLLAPYIPKGGTVVDVGAFIGDHTEFYATAVGITGSVVAFEPNPSAYACLAHNMARHKHVTCINAGLSNRSHKITIHQALNAGASRPKDGGDISALPLDSISLASCDFIKMDCEGFEPYALHGAERTIRHHRPVMLIEVNPAALEEHGFTPSDIFTVLDAIGYSYRNVYAGQAMSGEQYDILCTWNN